LKIDEVKHVTVLGAGVMGHGIAEVTALSGFEVALYDVRQEFLKSGLEKIKWSLSKFVEKGAITKKNSDDALRRIHGSLALDQAVTNSDLVIEAAPEEINVKTQLFKEVDREASRRTILASNTSTLPITELAQATGRPERFVGLHFFNPPPLMPLLEVIRGEQTDDETFNLSVEFGKKLGKEVIICRKDVPGFIVNRILGPLLNEAAWTVERKQGTLEQVDSTAVYKVGLPMGLFELADYSGIDTIYKASEAVRSRDPSNVLIAPIFKDMFERKKLGRKSGEGFYSYGPGAKGRPTISKGDGDGIDPLLVFAPAVNASAWLIRNSVCSKEDLDRAVKLGLGFPEGILQMADRWGIDRIVNTLREKQKIYGEFYKPDPLLEDLVGNNRTGVAIGKGFYDYSSSEKKLDEIIIRRSPPLAWIILNRPHRLNTVTQKLVQELADSVRELELDGSIRVIVVRGQGNRAFSAGADLTAFESSSPSKMFDSARKWFEAFTLLEKLPKPVVAAIEGYAFGGGCELALACDFRLASEDSQIGLTEAKLGLIPGAGGTQRLVRMVGLAKAKEMIFLGQRLTAEEALKIGLVNRVFKKEEFERGVLEFSTQLAKQPPLALKFAKLATTLSSQVPVDIGQLFEASSFGLLSTTQDLSEGISAFLAKEEPEFKGE
jgi:enoyl-CoA hydratase/3-hydroxyacyl-CoA dehydrogenase